jgi:hypothetical protein
MGDSIAANWEHARSIEVGQMARVPSRWVLAHRSHSQAKLAGTRVQTCHVLLMLRGMAVVARTAGSLEAYCCRHRPRGRKGGRSPRLVGESAGLVCAAVTVRLLVPLSTHERSRENMPEVQQDNPGADPRLRGYARNDPIAAKANCERLRPTSDALFLLELRPCRVVPGGCRMPIESQGAIDSWRTFDGRGLHQG